MKIRNAKIEDQIEISRLYRKLYSNEEGIELDTIPISNTLFKNILLVAEDQDKIMGFIWANFIAFGIRRYGYIEDLYVEMDYRKQGIAKSLITAVKEEFKNLNTDAVFVTTEIENQIAQNFYLKEGFNKCLGPWFQWLP